MVKTLDRDKDDRLALIEAKYRPAWSKPDQATLRLAREIRDEMRAAERNGGYPMFGVTPRG